MLSSDERDELYPESLWGAFHDAVLIAIEWRDSELAMEFESGWPRSESEQRTPFEWRFKTPFTLEIKGEIPELGRVDDVNASQILPDDARESVQMLDDAIRRTDFWVFSVRAKDESMAEFALIGCFNNAAGQPVEILIHASSDTEVLMEGRSATLDELLELGNAAWDSL